LGHTKPKYFTNKYQVLFLVHVYLKWCHTSCDDFSTTKIAKKNFRIGQRVGAIILLLFWEGKGLFWNLVSLSLTFLNFI